MKQSTKIFTLALLITSQIVAPIAGVATTNGEKLTTNSDLGNTSVSLEKTEESTMNSSNDEPTTNKEKINENENTIPSVDAGILTGVNGTSSWTFENGTLTLSEGQLSKPIASMTELNKDSIEKIIVSGPVKIFSAWVNSDRYGVFSDLNNLTTIENGSNIDVSGVKDLGFLFKNDYNLQQVDTSNWDVSQLERAVGVFYQCYQLKTVDVSNWDTSNVNDMSNMFNGCTSIDNLDVSKWNTSKVTSLDKTFFYNQRLSSLDVSNWDTSKVTNMFATFMASERLTELDVSNWDVSSVILSNSMLKWLPNIEKLDVSNWNVSNMGDMSGMFDGDSGLKELDLSNWNNDKAADTDSLLKGTVNLKKLSLSPNFKMVDKNNTGNGFYIPAIQKGDNYTGNWQTIGMGTAEKPLGDIVVDSKTLSQGSPSQNVETFVWQPVTLEGADYTMTIGDPQPTASDFKASATDKNGNPTEVAIDFSEVDFNHVGVYDVTLSTSDGQSKVVKLTIEDKKVDTVKVTFNAGKGGSLQGKTTIDIPKGSKVTDLPNAVADKSNIEDIYFLDWYQNGKIVNPKNIVINNDTTFTAKFGAAVYRLYNKNNGDHLLTKNKNEKDKVAAKGWKVETNPKNEYGRAAFYVPVQADSAGKKQVYRIYNPNSGEHFYTTNKSEANAAVKKGWRHETDNNYTWVSEGDVKIYREFNPDVHTAGSHNFTTDLQEHKNVVKAGWRDESKDSSLWTALKAGF
ncbi:BspA family leucine-rich repeat surface protein [Enterococcus gilvus]|jgi:surface protein|uniref:BspA family leucine-rich repeat surface protein n=1 Tax=Enterococcus gilvus TaxID=160453 RepID=UPI003D6A50F1